LERLVNPGSLGALAATSPEASYAVWEDGEVQLKRYSYCFQATIEEIRRMPVSSMAQEQMIGLITTGHLLAGKV
jgi:hypothetical protein